ncbi:hypothetical protein [Arthrobacter russicus]|uniref:Uncharacterized protein n=1 Tax=Arthrobacter russicus TaxID=172040 RepID=A0ABU1JD77_9MICC|nr:hypothetical protein [Arthrobacter russicus]MDR6269836.1 hypothetical protein [Arthrobacter russicus]
MKFLTNIPILITAFGLLLGAGVNPASATAPTVDLVAEFNQQMTPFGLNSDIQQQVVGKFDDLSFESQRQILAKLEVDREWSWQLHHEVLRKLDLQGIFDLLEQRNGNDCQWSRYCENMAKQYLRG